MKHNEFEFNQTLNHIQEVLGLSFDSNNIANPLFGGFYKSINRVYGNNNIEMSNYPIEVLDEFIDAPNSRFLRDNISVEVQYKFHVGFDPLTQRITVPWFDINGNLIGVTGRINFDEYGDIPKWLPIIPFSKGQTLFGLYENYENIKEQGYVIIR